MAPKTSKILVVEDQHLNRMQFKAVLEQEAYQVVEAVNGEEAVACYQTHQPDLILMNIQMPVMDGYEAARRIKALEDKRHVPIIFVSAESDEESIARALEVGGDDFVPKPFNPSLLRAKINVQLRIQTLNSSLQQNIEQLEWEIQDQKRTQKELQDISSQDTLTGLPNRHFFLIYLAQALNGAEVEQQGVALLMLDISNFKRVNDVYGHLLGDEVLKRVAQRLKQCVDESRMVARIGGDHFALLLESVTDSEEVNRIAQEVIDTIAAPYPIDGEELVLGCDIGIALYPLQCENAEAMMRCAGTALDFARREEFNSFTLFSADMQKTTEINHEVYNAIHGALERGEFELYYQPQVDAINRHIVGCEVLLRWHHPKLGMVRPDHFIPLLEREGLIREVGEWIMRASIQQHLDWIAQGLPGVRIAVNFSALQLQEEGFADLVIGVIKESGIAPPWFKLEITETTTMNNLEQVADALHTLRSAGIQVAVDDFGTGYSTLNYLQRLPVDIIKIDQQFVRDIPNSKEDMTLVKAVIAMAHSMGLDVVAEGVETEAQADFLRKHLCEELQGYFFSKPLPAKEFEALLSGQIDAVDETLTLF